MIFLPSGYLSHPRRCGMRYAIFALVNDFVSALGASCIVVSDTRVRDYVTVGMIRVYGGMPWNYVLGFSIRGRRGIFFGPFAQLPRENVALGIFAGYCCAFEPILQKPSSSDSQAA